MKKITTLTELAKECNCSIATVSYVLNGRTDKRISEKTKQKILQMANLFQYHINPYAKALATGELHNIMFFYKNSNFALEKSDVLSFINDLSTYLKQYNYNVIVAPINHVQRFSIVDAILTYRIGKETFLKIGDKNFVPLIAIDTIIDDNIFYEITNSFSDLIKDDQTIYLSTSYDDPRMNDLLKSQANVVFVDSFKELTNAIDQNKDKKIISLSQEIKNYLDSLNIEASYHSLDIEEKFKAIYEAIFNSTHREDASLHKIRIK